MNLRRLVAVPLAAVLLASTLVVPLLDADAAVHGVAVEDGGQHSSTCDPGHDHRLCVQFGANPPSPAEHAVGVALPTSPRPGVTEACSSSLRPAYSSGPSSRAPPADLRR